MWHPETFAGRMVYRLGYSGVASPLYQFDGTLASAASEELLLDYAISDGVLYGLRDDHRIVRTTDLLAWDLLAAAPAPDGRSLAVLDGRLYVGATEGRLYRYSVPIPEPGAWALAITGAGFVLSARPRRRRS